MMGMWQHGRLPAYPYVFLTINRLMANPQSPISRGQSRVLFIISLQISRTLRGRPRMILLLHRCLGTDKTMEDRTMHQSHRFSASHGRRARAVAIAATQDSSRHMLAGLLLLGLASCLIALLG
jgi:hypothetical protein